MDSRDNVVALDQSHIDQQMGLAEGYADLSDFDSAINICQGLLQSHPNCRPAADLMVRVHINNMQESYAVVAMQDVIESDPTLLWAYSLAGQACTVIIERDSSFDMREPDNLLQSALDMHKMSVTDAKQVLRQLLRRAKLWHELARHIEWMISLTWNVNEQVSLHEELAEILAARLSDPLNARTVRSTVDRLRDLGGLVSSYWDNIRNNPENPAVWNDAENFFRANNRQNDLATLLLGSMEGISSEQAYPILQELESLYTVLKEPQWQKLVDAAQHHLSGAEGEYKLLIADLLTRSKKQTRTMRVIAPSVSIDWEKILGISLSPISLFLIAAGIGVGVVIYFVN